MKIKICTFFIVLLFPITAFAQSNESIKAAKILLKRGFSPTVAASLIGNANHGTKSRIAINYLQKRSGMSPQKFENRYLNIQPGDISYDVSTGKLLWGNYISHSDFARSISKCYRRGKPWRDCRMRYHQEDGCYLTKRWLKLCRRYRLNKEILVGGVNIGDACFWEPKGDFPMIPSSKTGSQINLKRAKRIIPRRRVSRGNYLKRPLCRETDERLFPGRGISINNPKHNGHPIHWCLTPRKGCGYPAAKVFCKNKGYTNVAFVIKKRNTDFAVHIGSGETCSGGGCTIFTLIDCDQPKGRR